MGLELFELELLEGERALIAGDMWEEMGYGCDGAMGIRGGGHVIWYDDSCGGGGWRHELVSSCIGRRLVPAGGVVPDVAVRCVADEFAYGSDAVVFVLEGGLEGGEVLVEVGLRVAVLGVSLFGDEEERVMAVLRREGGVWRCRPLCEVVLEGSGGVVRVRVFGLVEPRSSVVVVDFWARKLWFERYLPDQGAWIICGERDLGVSLRSDCETEEMAKIVQSSLRATFASVEHFLGLAVEGGV